MENKKYLVFDDPFHNMSNASYWVVTFRAEGYDECNEVNMIAYTNKLVIRDEKGEITHLFDDKYDYGWNYKFDIDTRKSFAYIYYQIYCSNENTDIKPDFHKNFLQFFKDLKDYLNDNKTKIHQNFKIYMGIDNLSNKCQIFYLNPDDFIESDDNKLHQISLDGVNHLYSVFENMYKHIHVLL